MVDQNSIDELIDNSISVTTHKIIFVGDAWTGKTIIINRIIDNPFNETYEISIGIDFMSKNIRFRGQNIKIQIWDSAGQEKYKGLIPSYVRNSSIVFIVYDVSNRQSFNNVAGWISFVRSIENTTMILCGNKIDLVREVKTSEGEELAKREGILFFECSGKTNENIKNMFYSSIAILPTFGIYDESKKGNLIRELLKENEGEDYQEGNINKELINEPLLKNNEYIKKIEKNNQENKIEENKKEENIYEIINESIENINDKFSLKEVNIMLCSECNSNIEIKKIDIIQMEITYECLKCGIKKKLINEYIKTMIKYSNNLKKSQLCYNCNNKYEQNPKKLKYCLKCDKNVCLNCIEMHIKNNNKECGKEYIINYNEKNIRCKFHPKHKNKCYCEDCKINLCDECLEDKREDHTFHKKIFFDELNKRIEKEDFRYIVESLKKEKKKINYDKQSERNKLQD